VYKRQDVFRNIIENEVSEDDPYYEDFKNIYNDSRVEELTNELYNTSKALLPEGWDPVDNSIEDWFLTDKEGSLLNWNSKSGRFDGIKFKQIEEIAERMNLSTEEVVESVEELESLMREKMKGEDRKQLKRDWKNHWVNKVNEAKGGMPIDLDREWTDKEKAHHHASLNEALDTENVELITYALDNAGFFNGNQFYNMTEEDSAPLLQGILGQLGVNVYESAGARHDIAKRIGNNITIQAPNAPRLILHTNYHDRQSAENEAKKLRNYLIEYGSFQKIKSLEDLRKEQAWNVSDFRRQMSDQSFNKLLIDKDAVAYEVIGKIKNEGEKEIVKISEDLKLEQERVDKEFNDWMLNEAPLVNGVLDEELAKAKYNELSENLIKRQNGLISYANKVQDDIELVEYQLGSHENSFNDAIGAYNKMQSRKGTFESATINGFLTGTEHVLLGMGKIGGNLGIILGGSLVGDFSGIDGAMKDFNRDLEESRGSITKIGTRPLEQYVQASKEDFWYGAWLLSLIHI